MIYSWDGNRRVESYTTDKNGAFDIPFSSGARVRIEISHLGYKLFIREISGNESTLNLGKIRMSPDTYKLDEVVVQARIEMFRQKGDTVLFFPRSVRTMEGDNVLAILKQMPGMKVSADGKVTFMGRLIERTKINNRLIFGEDPTAAPKNVDAKDVSLIQVYDEADEREKILYGELGRKRKVMNIITFDKFDESLAATVRLEGGADQRKDINGERRYRYYVDIEGGYYNEKQQLVLNGRLDNRPFALAGILKPEGYRRIANTSVTISGMPGHSKYRLRYEYSDKHESKPEFSGKEYFPTEFFTTSNSSDSSTSVVNDRSHGIQYKYEHTTEKTNIMTFGNVTFKRSDIHNDLSSVTIRDKMPVIAINRKNQKQEEYISIQGTMIQIDKKSGANSFSFKLPVRFFQTDDAEIREDTIAGPGIANRKLLYVDDPKRPNIAFIPDLIYNINLKKAGILSLQGNLHYHYEKKQRIAVDRITGVIDKGISGDHITNQTQATGKLSYRIRKEKHDFSIGGEYTTTFLHHDETLPEYLSVRKRFYTFLPEATYSYNYLPGSLNTLRILLQTNSRPLSVRFYSAQIHDTNPMFLQTGNSDLKPEDLYILGILHNTLNPKKQQSLSTSLFVNLYRHKQVFERTYFDKTTILSLEYGNYEAPAGSTLIRPINADNSYNIEFKSNYKTRLSPIKSIFDLSVGYRYQNPQEGTSNRLVRTHEHNGSIGIGLTTNFSSNFRFNIKNSTQYQWFKNSDKYIDRGFRETLGADFRWDFLNIAFVTGSYTYETYNNSSELGEYENHILNASIGYRLFRNRKGRISFNAYDILDRTTNLWTSVNNQYISYIQKQMFSSYFTVAFEYRFNKKE